MKKVMILGAGIYQVPLILKSKALGHYTIVVSPDGAYPGLELGDETVFLDTTDIEPVLEKAIALEIDAVLTTGTDVAVPTIGRLVEELNLVGTKYTNALACMDKSLMKEAFHKFTVPTAAYHVTKSLGEAISAAESISYPVMVKASDSSGSRGVYRVNNRDELLDKWSCSMDVSRNGLVIVEEFLDGLEFGAQAIVIDGEVVDVIFHNDTVTEYPNNTPIGHSMPCAIPAEVQKNSYQVVVQAINALGIDNTIANVDLMLVENQPYIIEIGARMGATCLPENIEIYTGIDIYKLLVDIALGKSPKFDKNYPCQANAARLIVSRESGILDSISLDSKGTDNANLIKVSFDKEIGDSVKEFSVGPDRVGELIVIGSNSHECEVEAKELADQVRIEVS